MNFERTIILPCKDIISKGTTLKHCVSVKVKEKIQKIQNAQGLKFILHKMEINMA